VSQKNWTILLEVMKALPLSIIGSVHCEVFFGNTNFSTQDPSRSLTPSLHLSTAVAQQVRKMADKVSKEEEKLKLPSLF